MFEPFPFAVKEPLDVDFSQLSGDLQLFFEKRIKVFLLLQNFFAGINALCKDRISIYVPWIGMFGYGFIQCWLGISGLVTFIMSIFPVGEYIDEYIG